MSYLVGYYKSHVSALIMILQAQPFRSPISFCNFLYRIAALLRNRSYIFFSSLVNRLCEQLAVLLVHLEQPLQLPPPPRQRPRAPRVERLPHLRQHRRVLRRRRRLAHRCVCPGVYEQVSL